MATYPNGKIPAELLITIASGTNEDGYWEHQITAGTLAKHLALVRIGQERSGRTLLITPGWNVFRPLGPQRVARDAACARGRCQDAAVVGYSSHGGDLNGEDTLALDYWNWQWVFGTYEKFAEACREVGLVPGTFSWELWHAIDREPYRAVPAAQESAPIIIKKGPEDVPIFIRRQANNAAFIIQPGAYIKHVPNELEEQLLDYSTGGYADFFGLNDGDLSRLMWAYGFPELGGQVDRLPAGGAYHWAERNTPREAAASVVAEVRDESGNPMTIGAALGRIVRKLAA